MSETNNWRGVPLSELYGSQSPWGAPEFPVVSPGHNHAVLYHIPSSGIFVGDRPPKPQIGKDRWDSDHVRMPCSSRSLYPVRDSDGETRLEKRWELIEVALRKQILNSQDLANTILSYNTHFKKDWKFVALHKLFNDYLEEEESQYFFDVTLPEIAKLALALPKLVQSPIPLLKQSKNKSVSLSQQQISSLLANAFFCTFPRRNTRKLCTEFYNYSRINFSKLFDMKPTDDVMEKLKCICHYFRRVCTKAPLGVTTFTRRCVQPPLSFPAWSSSTVPIASLPLHVDPENTIEEADGLVQVDFANKFIGGGVLAHGSVQEEIRFVICPELIISMLFTESLNDNEALMMIGCERYSMYSGYGRNFHWTGDYVDQTPFDTSQRRRVAVLAIDATPYPNTFHEYRTDHIQREINKAWAGFSFGIDPDTSSLNYPGVATGNWGCGAFNGTPNLKSLLQIMACAQARRPMAYYTFNDYKIRDSVIGIYQVLASNNVTVGELYTYLIRFSRIGPSKPDPHAYIRWKLKKDVSQLPDEGGRNLSDEQLKRELQNPDEMMEFSDSSDPSQFPPTATSRKTTQESPELFSQGEIDGTLEQHNLNNSSHHSKAAASQSFAPNNFRLFDEVQKLDGQSGTWNVSVSTSLIKPTSESAMESSHTQSDAANELKKKVSRKITDYFNKK